MRKPCFTLCLFSRYFMVLWVIFSIIWFATLIASCLCVEHAYIFMRLCFFLVACSDDHLLCYMIIVVIFIWLFWCMIKLITCFTSCLLDHNLFVTLYLSFLSLDLPWRSNVFCASVSGYRYICSKCYIASRYRYKWVLPLFLNSRLSLEFCYRVFCHGIAKGGDCKVVIYNYILCWLYFMKKSVVIAFILFLVFCGILLYWV